VCIRPFRLEDKTGSIQVLVPGLYGNPGLVAPFIPGFTHGDGVRIEPALRRPVPPGGRGCPWRNREGYGGSCCEEGLAPKEQLARFQIFGRVQKELPLAR